MPTLTIEEMERDERFVKTAETLSRIRPAAKPVGSGGGGGGPGPGVKIPRATYRLQLNADFMYMQLQMLEAATSAGDERGSGARTNGTSAQR